MAPGGLARPEVLLCDADGCLFPSEEPAFEASAVVTNRALERAGARRRYGAEELRLTTTGQNFRTTITALLAAEGITPDAEMVEEWVGEERRAVTAHLGSALTPDPDVIGPLESLAEEMRLAVVSSSARERLDACFTATGLDGLFPAEARFSAEDSLSEPRSKPDPAIYRHALAATGADPEAALAVEDSIPGVRSAVSAGIPVVGNLQFVQAPERPERRDALLEAGARSVVASWGELARH